MPCAVRSCCRWSQQTASYLFKSDCTVPERVFPRSGNCWFHQVTAACAVQQATAQAAQAVDAERAQNKLLQGRLVDVGRMLHLLREADPRTANALPGLIRRCGLADVVPFQDLMAPVPEASAQGDGKGGAAAAGSKKRAAQEAEAAGAAAKKTKIAADRAAAGVMVAPMASMQALAPQAIQGAAEVQHVLLQTCQVLLTIP